MAEHGGSGTLYNRGCRCDECRAANTRRTAKRRAERQALKDIPSSVEHGKDGTYTNWGCRCEACTAAHAEACLAYYRRTKT